MYGFRPHLSPQDVLLQLKEDIIDKLTNHHKFSILALDIKGAFDNITHQAILQGLASTNCGHRLYNYIVSFLTNRTATVGIGHLRSDNFQTIPKGTPQGSVISPLLFNIGMKDLPPVLKNIPNLRHAIYADDLTLWTSTGSIGDQQDALQTAIQAAQQYLQARGLECAPEKSALLTLCKRTPKQRANSIPDPELSINGQPVPNVPHLRVLGLTLPKDGSGAQTILPLQRTLSQLMHLIHRVSHRRFGLQESDTLRIIQAILISRIAYGTPYLALKPSEQAKLNTAIRQAYKTALGLPPKTATEKLLQLGIHNTWEEIQEAHRISQLTRLQLTSTGRATLRRLGYSTPQPVDQKTRIPVSIRQYIRVAPIPRNMHPTYNKARREARARAIHAQYDHLSFTRYADASPYPHRSAHAASVTDANGKELTAVTTITTSIETAEEVAIAIAATTCEEYTATLTDSQSACRNFLIGRISPPALAILKQVKQLPEINIVWSPGHESLKGNESAHAAARAHTHRAVSQEGADFEIQETVKPSPLRTYADILAHYRQGRQQYPAPHPHLSRAEATIFRRLQTNSYPHNTQLHAIYPTIYPASCKYCPLPGNLYHLVWECQLTPSLTPNPQPTYEQWAAQLASSDLSSQRSLVERARMASAGQGIPD